MRNIFFPACYPFNIQSIFEPEVSYNCICCPWRDKLTLFLIYLTHTGVQWHLLSSLKNLICSLNWVGLCHQRVWIKAQEVENDKLSVHHKQGCSLPAWAERKECDVWAFKGELKTVFELLPLCLERTHKGGSTGRRRIVKSRGQWWIDHPSCRRKWTYSES